MAFAAALREGEVSLNDCPPLWEEINQEKRETLQADLESFGWRPNEACALKWPRVDFQPEKILIRQGRVLRLTGIPKSAGSIRDLDMLPPVREAMAAQKALSWLLGDDVFGDGQQRPVDRELFRMKVWEPVLKRLGIRYRPPYQMRHTFATLAISAGENVNWVARMLGHKSPVVTLERYNRFVPNLTRDVVEAAERLTVENPDNLESPENRSENKKAGKANWW